MAPVSESCVMGISLLQGKLTKKNKHKRDQNGPDVYVSLCSWVYESRDVDSHVSGTPQVGSRDQVTSWQLHTVISLLEAF